MSDVANYIEGAFAAVGVTSSLATAVGHAAEGWGPRWATFARRCLGAGFFFRQIFGQKQAIEPLLAQAEAKIDQARAEVAADVVPPPPPPSPGAP